MNNLKQFIRNEILDFKEYKTDPSVWDLAEKFGKNFLEIVKLNQGENFFGTSTRVKEALGNYNFYNYYPDPEYKKLRLAIGKSIKIPYEKIMVGSGSDELIDLIFRLTLNIGDEVINFPPSFGMYDVSIKLNRGKVVNIPRDKNYSIDSNEGLRAVNQKTKVIIICSPNNPTGNLTPRESIIKFLKTGRLVMLDEAYAEYANENNLDLIKKYPNLMILRTFSKWAGIAGLRLGYVIMNEYLISQLMKIKSPFNVNLAAEAAGIEILKDSKFAKKSIKKLKKERERLYKNLTAIPYLKVFPTETNFIFANVKVSNFEDFKRYLFKNQIVVRYFDTPLVGKSIRITIGRLKTNKRLFEVLKRYRQPSIDGIIFDMDGVLIDVSRSYRTTILKTVNDFLKNTSATVSDVMEIKKIPGFNNDWDATFMLYKLLSKGKSKINFSKSAKPLKKEDKKSKLYESLKNKFQQYYLQTYRYNENLLILKQTLNDLSSNMKLGIATSRPREEAIFAIRQFGLEKFFSEETLVAQEDSKKEKPYPDPLIEAKARLNVKNPIYVGDTVNDYLAAKAANLPFVLIGKGTYGDFQINSVNNLMEVLNA